MRDFLQDEGRTMIDVNAILDMEEALDELTLFWLAEGLTYHQATVLGIYQLTAGSLFDPQATAPRPIC
jgi:hypothetical protein